MLELQQKNVVLFYPALVETLYEYFKFLDYLNFKNKAKIPMFFNIFEGMYISKGYVLIINDGKCYCVKNSASGN